MSVGPPEAEPGSHHPTDARLGRLGARSAEVGRGRHGNGECQDLDADPSFPFGPFGFCAEETGVIMLL